MNLQIMSGQRFFQHSALDELSLDLLCCALSQKACPAGLCDKLFHFTCVFITAKTTPTVIRVYNVPARALVLHFCTWRNPLSIPSHIKGNLHGVYT